MAIEASIFCHLLLDIWPFIQCVFLFCIWADGVHSSFWDKRAVAFHRISFKMVLEFSNQILIFASIE